MLYNKRIRIFILINTTLHKRENNNRKTHKGENAKLIIRKIRDYKQRTYKEILNSQLR